MALVILLFGSVLGGQHDYAVFCTALPGITPPSLILCFTLRELRVCMSRWKGIYLQNS